MVQEQLSGSVLDLDPARTEAPYVYFVPVDTGRLSASETYACGCKGTPTRGFFSTRNFEQQVHSIRKYGHGGISRPRQIGRGLDKTEFRFS